MQVWIIFLHMFTLCETICLQNVWNLVTFKAWNPMFKGTFTHHLKTFLLKKGQMFRIYLFIISVECSKQFWVFFEKIKIIIFCENTQNCLTYSSEKKYRSEVVLYLKRTAGYLLSPEIETIAVAFYKLSNKATNRALYWSFWKNTQLWAYLFWLKSLYF